MWGKLGLKQILVTVIWRVSLGWGPPRLTFYILFLYTTATQLGWLSRRDRAGIWWVGLPLYGYAGGVCANLVLVLGDHGVYRQVGRRKTPRGLMTALQHARVVSGWGGRVIAVAVNPPPHEGHPGAQLQPPQPWIAHGLVGGALGNGVCAIGRLS